jgi:hypothetical protein
MAKRRGPTKISFLLFLFVFLSAYSKRILVPATAFYSFMIKTLQDKTPEIAINGF